MSVHLPEIAEEDLIQKTWIPEGTEEYKQFKFVTQENFKLIEVIKKHFPLGEGDLVLDVGGRDGQIGFAVQNAKLVHIVDPDPTIMLLQEPGMFWNEKIQKVDFGDRRYKLIICSHVLGYLGKQEVQEAVTQKLLDLLEVGGTLLLFYNTNFGYMGELLAYSKEVLKDGHYDYFNEALLDKYADKQHFEIKKSDVCFTLDYKNYNDLARCCWFLFGAIDPNIEGCAEKFLPKLNAELFEPNFVIDERMIFVKRLK